MRIERLNDSMFTLYVEQLGKHDEVDEYVRLKDAKNIPGLRACGEGYIRSTCHFVHENGREEKLTTAVFRYGFVIKEPGATITFERDAFYNIIDAMPFPDLSITRPK